MPRDQVAKTIGATTQTLRLWVKKARAVGAMPPATAASHGTLPGASTPRGHAASAPADGPTPEASDQASPFAARDPGQGLALEEEQAILEEKKRHPSMRPA